ncbi:hypothetical protein [Sporisorium scitamineum]|uniref:Uncharacterized protein n=1 Tax=Sporisorium scitamineum TaxID=49012 RepID=A0A0F7S7S4_9BASI|nr:hypothetical protein [Sporisorium scitamineum]
MSNATPAFSKRRASSGASFWIHVETQYKQAAQSNEVVANTTASSNEEEREAQRKLEELGSRIIRKFSQQFRGDLKEFFAAQGKEIKRMTLR